MTDSRNIAAILAAQADTKAALDGTSASSATYAETFSQLLARYLAQADDRPGRRIGVTAAGDTEEELETAAMAEARKFFGPDADLTLHRTYTLSRNTSPHFRTGQWAASVVITENAPAGQ